MDTAAHDLSKERNPRFFIKELEKEHKPLYHEFVDVFACVFENVRSKRLQTYSRILQLPNPIVVVLHPKSETYPACLAWCQYSGFFNHDDPQSNDNLCSTYLHLITASRPPIHPKCLVILESHSTVATRKTSNVTAMRKRRISHSRRSSLIGAGAVLA